MVNPSRLSVIAATDTVPYATLTTCSRYSHFELIGWDNLIWIDALYSGGPLDGMRKCLASDNPMVFRKFTHHTAGGYPLDLEERDKLLVHWYALKTAVGQSASYAHIGVRPYNDPEMNQ